ncbi:MAG: hypothetical protein ACOC04_04305 [Halothece sp.]
MKVAAEQREQDNIKSGLICSAFNAFLQGAGKKNQTFDKFLNSVGLGEDKKKNKQRTNKQIDKMKKQAAIARAEQIKKMDLRR